MAFRILVILLAIFAYSIAHASCSCSKMVDSYDYLLTHYQWGVKIYSSAYYRTDYVNPEKSQVKFISVVDRVLTCTDIIPQKMVSQVTVDAQFLHDLYNWITSHCPNSEIIAIPSYLIYAGDTLHFSGGGLAIEVWPNRQLLAGDTFNTMDTAGLKQGIWLTYKGVHLETFTWYENGQVTGYHIQYYKNGQEKLKASFYNNEVYCDMVRYNKKGIITSRWTEKDNHCYRLLYRRNKETQKVQSMPPISDDPLDLTGW